MLNKVLARPPLRLTAFGAALVLLVATVTIAVVRGREQPSPVPPSGVRLEGSGVPPELQEAVFETIVRLRKRDVQGLAALDVNLDTHSRGGTKALAGAQWLITNYADLFQGRVDVELRLDELSSVGWDACFSYGSPQRRLLLDFIRYGRKGFWPDPDGGDGFSGTAGAYAGLLGKKPEPRTDLPDVFCDDGIVTPEAWYIPS